MKYTDKRSSIIDPDDDISQLLRAIKVQQGSWAQRHRDKFGPNLSVKDMDPDNIYIHVYDTKAGKPGGSFWHWAVSPNEELQFWESDSFHHVYSGTIFQEGWVLGGPRRQRRAAERWIKQIVSGRGLKVKVRTERAVVK